MKTNTLLHEIQIDQRNPIERIQYYLATNPLDVSTTIILNKNGSKKMAIINLVLLVLQAIDSVLKEKLHYHVSFYLQSDTTVDYFLSNFLSIHLQKDELFNALYLLEKSDLIFRFTCAKKFAIEDQTQKQLRINSWGENYANTFLSSSEYDLLRTECKNKFIEYFEKNEDGYQSMGTLLMKKIEPESASQIAKYNAHLSIKLLS